MRTFVGDDMVRHRQQRDAHPYWQGCNAIAPGVAELDCQEGAEVPGAGDSVVLSVGSVFKILAHSGGNALTTDSDMRRAFFIENYCVCWAEIWITY